ncbi:MAG: hypothetical protein AAF581_08420 [Planctomycetota bacterium]
MALNKEKIVCLICLLIFLGTVYFSFSALGEVSSEKPEFRMAEVGDSGPRRGHPDDWQWFKFDATGAQRQDPFEKISNWSGANPDPMPLPPRADLARRMPLPGVLIASVAARPPLEMVPPTPKEEKEDLDDE